MNLLIRLLLSTLSVLIASYILPGVKIASLPTALVVAIVLGVANAIIKPILLILTLPLTIITLGLFTFIINGFIVLLVTLMVPGFHVDNIWWAILFSIVVSLISSFLQKI